MRHRRPTRRACLTARTRTTTPSNSTRRHHRARCRARCRLPGPRTPRAARYRPASRRTPTLHSRPVCGCPACPRTRRWTQGGSSSSSTITITTPTALPPLPTGPDGTTAWQPRHLAVGIRRESRLLLPTGTAMVQARPRTRATNITVRCIAMARTGMVAIANDVVRSGTPYEIEEGG